MHVNLLPPELVAQSKLKDAIQSWTALITLCIITLAAIGAPFGWKAWKLYGHLQHLQTEVGPVRLKENKIQQLRNITLDLKKRTQRIESIQAPNRIPSLLGILGKTFQSKDGPIALQDLQINVHAVAKQPESPQRMVGAVSKSTGAHATQVVLRGFTGLQPTVAEVIQRLDGYGVFQNVLLRSTRDSVMAEQLVDEFELECSYAE